MKAGKSLSNPCTLLISLCLLIATGARAQTGTLSVICNAKANVFIDDENKGLINKGETKVYTLKPGSRYVMVREAANSENEAGEYVKIEAGVKKSLSLRLDNVHEAGKSEGGIVNGKYTYNTSFDGGGVGLFDCYSDDDREMSPKNGELIQRNKTDKALSCLPKFSQLNASGNWVAEVSYRYVSGDNKNYYGLVLASTNNEMIVFKVSPEGSYRLSQLVDNRWESVVDITTSTHIKTGAQTNTLKVEARNGFIYCYVNGKFLTSVHFGEAYGQKFGVMIEGIQTVAIESFSLTGEPAR